MESLRDIVEVKETTDIKTVNRLLGEDWELLAAAPGQDAQGYAFIRYSVGRVCTVSRKDVPQL